MLPPNNPHTQQRVAPSTKYKEKERDFFESFVFDNGTTIFCQKNHMGFAKNKN